MKHIVKLSLSAVLVLFTASAMGYQVTGSVVEVTDSKIVVLKGKEKFEIKKDTSTKSDGDAKVGDKVTVEYEMTASKVTAKGKK